MALETFELHDEVYQRRRIRGGPRRRSTRPAGNTCPGRLHGWKIANLTRLGDKDVAIVLDKKRTYLLQRPKPSYEALPPLNAQAMICGEVYTIDQAGKTTSCGVVVARWPLNSCPRQPNDSMTLAAT